MLLFQSCTQKEKKEENKKSGVRTGKRSAAELRQLALLLWCMISSLSQAFWVGGWQKRTAGWET